MSQLSATQSAVSPALSNQSMPSASSMIQRGNGLQVVVGLGKSGLSAVNYLHALGYPVAVTDAGLPKLAEHLPTDIVTKFGALDGELFAKADGVVI